MFFHGNLREIVWLYTYDDREREKFPYMRKIIKIFYRDGGRILQKDIYIKKICITRIHGTYSIQGLERHIKMEGIE